jgi:hypothetical protein
MWRSTLCVVAVCAMAAITAGATIASFDANPTSLVHATTVEVQTPTAGLYLRDPAKNYDGVFFYRLARNPFTTQQVESGVHLDVPAYRQQRILYPLLAWALAGGGNASEVGWALVAINLVAFGALAWAAATICAHYGRSVWWGAGVALLPGLAISLLYDLSEVVSTALVAAACLALVRKRPGWTAVALSLAVLARETTAVLAVAVAWPVALAAIRGRPRPTLRTIAVAASPLVVLAIWQALLWRTWDELATTGGDSNFALPLVGLVRALGHATDGLDGLAIAGAALGVVALVALAATAVRRSTIPDELRLAWALYAVIAVFLSDEVWASYQASLRVMAELTLLSVLVITAAPRRNWHRLVPLADVAGFGAVALIDVVFLR